MEAPQAYTLVDFGQDFALTLVVTTWVIVLLRLARWTAPWFKGSRFFSALLAGSVLLALGSCLEFAEVLHPDSTTLAEFRTGLYLAGAALFITGVFPVVERIITLLRRLDRAANTDILTGARTRHAIFAVMQDLVRRKQPFSIIIGDLDGLKPINDHYGHAAGDRLLVETAAVIQSALPEGTEIARMGGDEFLAVLPGLACSEKFLETIRRRVKELPFPYPVGISLGYACYPGDGDSLQAVLALADTRMYEEKRKTGLNVRSKPPPRVGETRDP